MNKKVRVDVFVCQVDKGSIVLASFMCQLDTGWSYHSERSFSWGSASMRSSCEAFSQLVIKVGGPTGAGTISGLVFLGFMREQTEQARGSKAVRNIPPWPLHQLLLPDLLEFQSWPPLDGLQCGSVSGINHFPPNLLLGHDVCAGIETLTKTMPYDHVTKLLYCILSLI